MQLKDADSVQLDLWKEDHPDSKRMKRVVIYAKLVGILKDIGRRTDRHFILGGSNSVHIRFIENRITQQAIKLFARTVRSVITKMRSGRTEHGNSIEPNVTSNGYTERDGYYLLDLEQ